ncbi:MAG: hypothetical protein EBZ36_13995, partial [Acidobacteria bacterium]|nr:hypothetical protein [Acidobacteriota bacterium]
SQKKGPRSILFFFTAISAEFPLTADPITAIEPIKHRVILGLVLIAAVGGQQSPRALLGDRGDHSYQSR